MLNYMVQYTTSALDLSFAALADATRRGIIADLSQSEASITTLAAKFQMTLTGMKKHVQVLERAGLVAVLGDGAAWIWARWKTKQRRKSTRKRKARTRIW